MPSKIWKSIEQERLQRQADELRARAAAAVDWQELYAGVNGLLAPRSIWASLEFGECRLRNWSADHEDVWWSKANAEKRRRELLQADDVARYPGVSIWDGTGTPANPSLNTARMLFEARPLGQEVGSAMLLLALVLHRRENGHGLRRFDSGDPLSRAEAACRSVHALVKDAYWRPGSRRLLPDFTRQQSGHAATYTELIQRLAEDARTLCEQYILVRIGSVLPQKSEAA